MRLAPVGVVLVFFVVSSAAEAGESLDPRYATPVREAARWIARQAKPLPSDAVAFPEYAEQPEERPWSLYAGGAGVLVFLENAASALDDRGLRQLADRAARGVLEHAPRGAGSGLYTGDAGLVHALLVRHRLRRDPVALRAAKEIADGLGRPSDVHDIISGEAGTALALLEVAAETGEKRYLDAAVAMARRLAAVGIADGGTLRWPARRGSERHYPNFSHGTSGVAYALARVAAASGDEACRDAALAGARWLSENAVRDGETLSWFHYQPGHEEQRWEGWCHGPAGTGRLFLALHSLTGEGRYLETARRSAAWIMQKRPSPGGKGARTRFYSPSLCCGAAGVLDFFVDLYRTCPEREYREYARQVGDYLVGVSKKDGDGRKWTNYDRPDEKGIVYHGVSLMLGSSGEALALLRLAAIDRREDPVVHLPDRTVVLGSPAKAGPVTPGPGASGPVARAETPATGHHGKHYVVLTSRLAPEDPWFRAALELARWRKGELITEFDPAAPERLIPRLRELGARYVALVLPPEEIDTNTQRRFVMAAARLDDDIFQDVAFGYVTGTAKTPPGEMVRRAKELEETGLLRRWTGISSGSNVSHTFPGAGDPTAGRSGWEGESIYLGTPEHDPGVLARVTSLLPKIPAGGVLELSGCGDPEGIWLFDDERNGRPEKHWPFDPKRVGEDPKGEMPRITAERLAGLSIPGAVVWTGVCHLGSLCRVFVEGDIVSTFGVASGHTEYMIPAGRSVGAAILDAGAAAFIAPIGPNHGYATMLEAQEALEKGLSLGDVLRATHNDVAVALGGQPELDLHLPGGGPVDGTLLEMMAGGGANRALFGDPALAPWSGPKAEPALAVAREPMPDRKSGFVVRAVVEHRDFWCRNLFAGDGSERIRVVVPLEESDPRSLQVTAKAFAPTGDPVPLVGLEAHVELHDRGRLLHLQASAAPGSGLDGIGARAEFRVTPTPR